MLGSLATTSMLCSLTDARLVRKLHCSLYLSFTWLKLITEYKWLLTQLNFHHLTIITVSKYYRFHNKNFLCNHKCTVSHYIIFCIVLWLVMTDKTHITSGLHDRLWEIIWLMVSLNREPVVQKKSMEGFLFNSVCVWFQNIYLMCLTHCGLVMPYGVMGLSQHWFR